ncbi:unnamed protein product [Lactuca saligna]|uniref:RRM domain-containing protein n=1 Tax=Lactuca saligna TaxID=75948 RepID=A0AA36EMK0_LACSI|nr:unnamed protein product [Lactuca saligna]
MGTAHHLPYQRSNPTFSNNSLLKRLSCNVYVTNFPSHFIVRELWNTCDRFEKVIDVFIPNKRSKLGKPFAFLKLIANIAHFNRHQTIICKCYSGKHLKTDHDLPYLVLDKSCINFKDDPLIRGLWVMLKLQSIQAFHNFKRHEGINSWFSQISKWTKDFVVQDRVLWVDIEGLQFMLCLTVPL